MIMFFICFFFFFLSHCQLTQDYGEFFWFGFGLVSQTILYIFMLCSFQGFSLLLLLIYTILCLTPEANQLIYSWAHFYHYILTYDCYCCYC